jgi:serine/threonine protein kinase
MTAAYAPCTRIDHYEIIRMLGQGGMNSVYLAEDIFNRQKVVLKFPNADLIGNVGVYERYKREADINHPYDQHLLNTDENRSQYCLVYDRVSLLCFCKTVFFSTLSGTQSWRTQAIASKFTNNGDKPFHNDETFQSSSCRRVL